MLREALSSLVLVASVLALAPAVPALPVACDALLLAEEWLQNDAGGGGDAPDAAEAARPVAADGYYSGYLSALDHENADLVDWYVYTVPEGIDAMHANITWEFPLLPTYTLELPTYVQVFTLTLFPPGGAQPRSVTPYDPTLTLADPVPGDYFVRVTTTTVSALTGCPASSAPAPVATASLARNHGMYLGCDPLCANGGPMNPTQLDRAVGVGVGA